MAPMTISPFAGWLISTYDWRTAHGRDGRRRLGAADPGRPLRRAAPPAPPAASAAARPPRAARLTAGRALRSPQFLDPRRHLLLLLRRALRADLPHGELRHRLRHPDHGGGHDLQRRGPRRASGGRLLFGVAADRFGVKRVIVVGLLVQALRRPGLPRRARRSATSTSLAIVFGMAYGGVMPLYAVLAREYFASRSWARCSAASTMLVEPRHGARAARRRLDLRHLRQLRLALHRLGRLGLAPSPSRSPSRRCPSRRAARCSPANSHPRAALSRSGNRPSAGCACPTGCRAWRRRDRRRRDRCLPARRR